MKLEFLRRINNGYGINRVSTFDIQGSISYNKVSKVFTEV